MKTFALLSIAAFALLGCDKVCQSTVQNSVTVYNATGAALEVVLCKGTTDKYTVDVAAAPGAQSIAIGTQVVQKVSGGVGSCSGDGVTLDDAPLIGLSYESFALATLCRATGDNTQVALVSLGSACPEGMLAQVSPQSCDSSLVSE